MVRKFALGIVAFGLPLALLTTVSAGSAGAASRHSKRAADSQGSSIVINGAAVTRTVSSAEQRAAVRYWTPARMKEANPTSVVVSGTASAGEAPSQTAPTGTSEAIVGRPAKSCVGAVNGAPGSAPVTSVTAASNNNLINNGTLNVASTAGFPASGQITVITTAPANGNGTAVLAYTILNGTQFTITALVSGNPRWTVVTGNTVIWNPPGGFAYPYPFDPYFVPKGQYSRCPYSVNGKLFYTKAYAARPSQPYSYNPVISPYYYKDFVCSATSIVAPTNNAVWTAGHCLASTGAFDGSGYPLAHTFFTKFLFVPAFNGNAKHPYRTTFGGRWAANQVVVSTSWICPQQVLPAGTTPPPTGPPVGPVDPGAPATCPAGTGTIADFTQDYGGLTVQVAGPENLRCPSLAACVGTDGFAFNQPTSEQFSDFGYPAGSPFTGYDMYECVAATAIIDASMGTGRPPVPGAGPNPLGIGCQMTGGSSGGAWDIGWTPTSSGYLNSDNSYGYTNCALQTAVAAASNGKRIDNGTLNVNNTAGFTSGLITVVTVNGVAVLRYTGTNGTQFTGVTVVTGNPAWKAVTKAGVYPGAQAGNMPGYCQAGAEYGPYLDTNADMLRLKL